MSRPVRPYGKVYQVRGSFWLSSSAPEALQRAELAFAKYRPRADGRARGAGAQGARRLMLLFIRKYGRTRK